VLVHTSAALTGSGQGATFASHGTSSFLTATPASSGADTRAAFGDGTGVYGGFFNTTNITKFALVNGTGSLQDPASNTKYAIYDALDDGTGTESIYDVLSRIGGALVTSSYLGVPSHASTAGDALVQTNSTTEITGNNAYSALVSSSSGGTGWGNSGGAVPDKFVVYGESFSSDHDWQALCAFSGTLASNSGKADGWRGATPAQTYWTFGGGDFNSNSATLNIAGGNMTTGTGVPSSATPVYLLAFGD
tara:strand:- start:9531 stop:10274 length:744 start_codon:yes stop_codon:yes gene_type:complete